MPQEIPPISLFSSRKSFSHGIPKKPLKIPVFPCKNTLLSLQLNF
jgi:hypothetical protein